MKRLCDRWAILETVRSILLFSYNILSFPGGSDGKASARNAGYLGSIPWLGRSPGEEAATHSSTRAWRIPWTEEPGRLQSVGSQRVGHNRATSLSLCFFQTAARQASLSNINPRSPHNCMSFESTMPSNHLIFCGPLLFPPLILPSIRVFSNEDKVGSK